MSDNDTRTKHGALFKTERGSSRLGPEKLRLYLGRKYLQVNGQRPIVVSGHAFQFLRGMHSIRGHASQQLTEEGSAVNYGRDLSATVAVRAYETDEAAFLGALTHQGLNTFLRNSPSALKHPIAEELISSSAFWALRVIPTAAPASLKAEADSKMCTSRRG